MAACVGTLTKAGRDIDCLQANPAPRTRFEGPLARSLFSFCRAMKKIDAIASLQRIHAEGDYGGVEFDGPQLERLGLAAVWYDCWELTTAGREFVLAAGERLD